VNNVAEELRSAAHEVIDTQLNELIERVFTRDERPDIFVTEGGPDHNNSHWYKFELTSINENSQKWINFSEGHYFVKASVRFERVRLVFVVSFHHIGKELTGVMETSSFAVLETYDEAGELVEEDSERVGRKTIPTSVEPFAVTWNTHVDSVRPAFYKWLDASIAIALKEWGDRL